MNDNVNGFSVAISQLDQERRRLSLLQQAEREKRQQQQEIFDLTRQKLELENERLQMDNKKLQEESQMRAKTLEHTGALTSAWTEYMSARELPQTETEGFVSVEPGRIQIRGPGGTKRKTERARAAFDEALLRASSEAPGAIQQLFAITEGLSKMENLPEETQARLGYLKAQTDVMRGKADGTGAASPSDVKMAIEAELKGREALDKKLGAETGEDIDKRWTGTITGKKDSLAAVTTSTQQLLATLAAGFVSSEDTMVQQLGVDLQKSGTVIGQVQARTASAASAHAQGSMLQQMMDAINSSTVKQSVVTEAQKAQYDQLRSNLAEARRGAQELGQLYERRDQDLQDNLLKKEIAHSLFGEQLKGGANAHVAATTAAETTLRLFGEISRLEGEKLDNNASYKKALEPTATDAEQKAALAAIREAAAVPDPSASDYQERSKIFEALTSHFKSRRTARANPLASVVPSTSLLK